ncbi:MAG: A/G-specific adenine glycosylase [Acidobacteriota bacterium]
MSSAPAVVRQQLLDWFEGHRRDLPWRQTTDPYRLWVAETLAQQTQAARAAAYYLRFIARFPTVAELAAADLNTVLKLWEGLGYYQRAQRLHRAAQEICGFRQGQLPTTFADWQTLPGVGSYTAAAIASMAFGEAVPSIDGNVRRVLARFYALDIGDDAVRQDLVVRTAAQALVSGERPGDVNQALMELGALVCRPRSPRCSACPLADDCAAQRQGRVAHYPLRPPRRVRPTRQFVCLLLTWRTHFLVVRRHHRGLLGGLWEFPTFPCQDGERPDETAANGWQRLGLPPGSCAPGPVLTHDFTHFRQVLHLFSAAVETPGAATDAERRWVTPEELDTLPLTRLARRLASRWQR